MHRLIDKLLNTYSRMEIEVISEICKYENCRVRFPYDWCVAGFYCYNGNWIKGLILGARVTESK